MPLYERSAEPAALVVAAAGYAGIADYYCTGTNDQVPIQAAIDALGATGGVVQLTPGTYTVALAGTATGDSLSTPYCILIDAADGPLVIQGAGMGATTIRLASSQGSNTIPLLVRGAAAGKRTAATTIRGIAFDGNSASQSAWTDFGLVEAVYADNVTLEACQVADSPYFLTQTFRNSQDARWVRCRFVSSATNHQVRFEAPGVSVIDCDFEGAAGATAGALLALATNADIDVNTREARVIGNRFRGGFQAINLGGAQRCVVLGNNVEDQTNTNSESIKVEHYTGAVNYSATHNIIAHNVLHNIRNGIVLGSTTTYGAQYNHVVGNRIIDGPDVALSNGIRETGDSVDNNVIEFNTVVGAATPITVAGAASIARNNVGATSNDDLLASGDFVEGANITLTPGAGTLTIAAAGSSSTAGSKTVALWSQSPTGSITLTNIGAALSEPFTRTRYAAELTDYTEGRVSLYLMTVGNSASKIGAQYSADGGSNWFWFDGTAGGSAPGATNSYVVIDTGANTVRSSSWITLAAGALADVLLRAVTLDGDGAADPVVAYLYVEFR